EGTRSALSTGLPAIGSAETPANRSNPSATAAGCEVGVDVREESNDTIAAAGSAWCEAPTAPEAIKPSLESRILLSSSSNANTLLEERALTRAMFGRTPSLESRINPVLWIFAEYLQGNWPNGAFL